VSMALREVSLRDYPMAPRDPAVAIEGIRQFLKRHATCFGISLDTPDLPRSGEYRALAACRCGETIEYWIEDALLPRQDLVDAVLRRRAA
jgi:hypothetical protein